MLSYFLQSFAGPAGPFMYALLLLLGFALAVMIERAWSLSRYACDPVATLARVQAALAASDGAAGGPPPALGTRPMEQVLQAGLAQPDAGLAAEAMDAELAGAELQIRRRIGYLSTIASVSTMVGLVGTVYGLILSFGAVGTVSAAERAARLSEGSATAMATTAFGLVVAIPALVAWSVADARARELVGAIEVAAGRLVVLRKAGARA